jgi:TIR domain
MSASTGNVLGRIFMSYRRDDTAYPAGWLFDRLTSHFGRGQVFKDIDSIELGDDFVEVITTAVESCDVLLAVIGDRWLTITDQDGQRRLDNPDDFVRLEIEAALTRNVRVIPILVEGARMPRADELPASLAGLVRRQALDLSPSRFDFDTRRLLKVLDRTITAAQEQASREAAARHRQQVEQLQDQIRERAAVQDWDAVLAANDQLTALDPAAADPDALASTAREQIALRREAEEAAARHRQQVEEARVAAERPAQVVAPAGEKPAEARVVAKIEVAGGAQRLVRHLRRIPGAMVLGKSFKALLLIRPLQGLPAKIIRIAYYVSLAWAIIWTAAGTAVTISDFSVGNLIIGILMILIISVLIPLGFYKLTAYLDRRHKA